MVSTGPSTHPPTGPSTGKKRGWLGFVFAGELGLRSHGGDGLVPSVEPLQLHGRLVHGLALEGVKEGVWLCVVVCVRVCGWVVVCVCVGGWVGGWVGGRAPFGFKGKLGRSEKRLGSRVGKRLAGAWESGSLLREPPCVQEVLMEESTKGTFQGNQRTTSPLFQEYNTWVPYGL